MTPRSVLYLEPATNTPVLVTEGVPGTSQLDRLDRQAMDLIAFTGQLTDDTYSMTDAIRDYNERLGFTVEAASAIVASALPNSSAQ